MAPKPVEDVNFPDLLEQILQPLLTLVSDLFVSLWTYLSGMVDFVISHPILGTPILAIGFVVLSAVFNVPRDHLLHCLDAFKRRGVLRDPDIPNYQSTGHGGNVPKGSTQSQPGGKGGGGSRAADGTGPSGRR